MQTDTLSTTNSKAKSLYDVGKLHSELGDFQTSIEKLKAAAELFHQVKKHDQFFKCHVTMLRMYAEMENVSAIEKTKELLQNYVIDEKIELNSRIHYSLALCSHFRGNAREALENLEKALALALADDCKEDICYAISGLAIVYCSLGRYEDALKEIYNLRVFFQVLDLPEVEISAQILNGYIFVDLKRYDEALDLFWKVMETLKSKKNFYMYVTALFAMGLTHAEAGDADLARTYLLLAEQIVDPLNFVYLYRHIKQQLQRVAKPDMEVFDLVFDNSSNSVIERKKGRIDFKNQFILLDMLKLFLKHPGEIYSKEALVKAVWRQEYDPSVHDNKIYVTIKRLRQLIEPDFEKPKYIYRAKNGYYLNRDARVIVQ